MGKRDFAWDRGNSKHSLRDWRHGAARNHRVPHCLSEGPREEALDQRGGELVVWGKPHRPFLSRLLCSFLVSSLTHLLLVASSGHVPHGGRPARLQTRRSSAQAREASHYGRSHAVRFLCLLLLLASFPFRARSTEKWVSGVPRRERGGPLCAPASGVGEGATDGRVEASRGNCERASERERERKQKRGSGEQSLCRDADEKAGDGILGISLPRRDSPEYG